MFRSLTKTSRKHLALERRRLLAGLDQVDPQILFENAESLVAEVAPELPGLMRARAEGTLSEGETDIFEFVTYSEDSVTIRLDQENESLATRLVVRNSAGVLFASDSRFRAHAGVGYIDIDPLESESGRFFVEVNNLSSTKTSDYAINLIVGRGVHLERRTSNDSIEDTHYMAATYGDGLVHRTVVGSFLSTVAGTPDVDFNHLGTFDPGDSIRLKTVVPQWSDAEPVVEIVDDAGETLSELAASNDLHEYEFETSGDFYAKLTGAADPSPDAYYVFSVETDDLILPSVTNIHGLPEQNGTSEFLITSFYPSFSESVNKDSTYYLRVSTNEPVSPMQYDVVVSIRRQCVACLPRIESVHDLPEQGETATNLVNGFTIELNQPVDEGTLVADGVKIVQVGADSIFDSEDDISFTTRAKYLTQPWRIEVDSLDGPLTPGAYRVEFTDLVADRDGQFLDGNSDDSPGGTFTRHFTVPAFPADWTLEGPGSEDIDGATALELRQDSSGTELLRAPIGYGSLGTSTEIDWWQFDLEAGDQVTIDGITRAEVSAEDAEGVLVTLYEFSADGMSVMEVEQHIAFGGQGGACTIRAEIAESGVFFVAVSAHAAEPVGDYLLRANVARTSEPESDIVHPRNNSASYADSVQWETTGTAMRGRVTGLIADQNDKDYWHVGRLPDGASILVDATTNPDWSTVSPIARIYRVGNSGSRYPNPEIDLNPADGIAFAESLVEGDYVIELSATSDQGLDATYFAQIEIEEQKSPQVVSTTGLPSRGSVPVPSFASFSVTFDEAIQEVVWQQGEGDTRVASISGRLYTPDTTAIDRDRIGLPGINAGETITVQYQGASWSDLRPLVELDRPGRPQREHAELVNANDRLVMTAEASGTYFIEIVGLEGYGVDSHYRLNVTISDAQLAPERPDLAVAPAGIFSTTLIDPRANVDVSWTTTNLGLAATNSAWTEHLYFSESSDGSDRQLLGV